MRQAGVGYRHFPCRSVFCELDLCPEILPAAPQAYIAPRVEAPTDRMLLPPRVAAAYLRWIRYRPEATEQVFLGATRQALHQKLMLLSQKAEVPYQGYQGLRLAGARRVYQDSKDLKVVAAFLRVSLSQVRRYVRAGIFS
ncbi:hypothetical protein Dxin01_03637 [Deinococcus xinjiangensis]|uniref:Uncharacterized protein n=1 Tax=Deinococcus xinjiangensis TaxID=457454 RepID=A0ABP9VHW2_9DEIO